MTTTYKQKLNAIIEADRKRTQGEWVLGYWTGRCNKDHRHFRENCVYDYTIENMSDIAHHHISLKEEQIEVVTTTSEYGAMAKKDSEFICLSANNAAEIARVCKEAIEVIQEVVNLSEYGTLESPQEFKARKACKEFLSKLEEGGK